jgi:hypothetical protein
MGTGQVIGNRGGYRGDIWKDWLEYQCPQDVGHTGQIQDQWKKGIGEKGGLDRNQKYLVKLRIVTQKKRFRMLFFFGSANPFVFNKNRMNNFW